LWHPAGGVDHKALVGRTGFKDRRYGDRYFQGFFDPPDHEIENVFTYLISAVHFNSFLADGIEMYLFLAPFNNNHNAPSL
jgi:hypothetical protein